MGIGPKEDRMRGSRFTQEQIVSVLKEHEAGAAIAALCRQHGISEQTLYRWKQKYGGLERGEATRLNALADENARLKRRTILTMGLAQRRVVDVEVIRSLLWVWFPPPLLRGWAGSAHASLLRDVGIEWTGVFRQTYDVV
jgi:putative transposase